VETRATPSGWYQDPTGRFEYRYFNGVQWMPDVAANGQRYVDVPMDQVRMAQVTVRPSPARRPRGMAITSFITAMAAVLLGWVPFVFALAAAAAIAAFVFGALGLRTALQHDGYGRGFAITGLLLSPVALAVCVGGFFFTKAVLHELHDFVKPGPHQVIIEQPCTVDNGRATARGSIHNLDDQTHAYRIVVDFTPPGDGPTSATARVKDVRAGATSPWSTSTAVSGTSVTCKVAKVFGPFPFDLDNQS
jgi:hypothetical protein